MDTNIKPGMKIKTDKGEIRTVAEQPAGLAAGWVAIKPLPPYEDGLNYRHVSRIVEVLPSDEETAKKVFPVTATEDQYEFNERLLELAVEYELPVSFTYRKANGDVSSREVTPETITTTRDDHVLFAGDERSYRLDRIIGYASI